IQDRANIDSGNDNGNTSESLENRRDTTVENPDNLKETRTKKLDQTKKTNENVIEVINQPEAITVLVNKQYKLPDYYEPNDLIYPNVRFTFSGKLEKKKMRKEAANALEKMFAGAEDDGILLAGVSGYRSQTTQDRLYNSYVKRDGKEAADRYSAHPSHS